MNRKISFIFAGLLLSASMAFAQSASQPLGDYARSIRKSKDAPAASQQKKVYDNDTLPAAGPVSVVGNSAGSDQPKNAEADSAASDQTTGTRVQPGRTSGPLPQRRDLRSGQQPIAAAYGGHAHANTFEPG